MQSPKRLTIYLLCIAYATGLIECSHPVRFSLEEFQNVVNNREGRLADGGGCFYSMRYYNHGERINSTEPCLNCNCIDSKLKCFMKVCPLIKPLQDGCTIEQRPGECCPTVTCADLPVYMLHEPDYEQTTSTAKAAKKRTRSSGDDRFGEHMNRNLSRRSDDRHEHSTTMASENNRGCLVDGTYYEEGEQLPTNKTNGRCENCYCVENAKACVIQQCELSIPGCMPRYKKDACCPYKYDCRKLLGLNEFRWVWISFGLIN